MNDPNFDAFISHRFADVEDSMRNYDVQAMVDEFKKQNPGRECPALGLLYISPRGCERFKNGRRGHHGNECDEMFDLRTRPCDTCEGK